MRNAFAATTGEPVASFGDGLLFIIGLWLVFHGRIAPSGGYRIDYGFQQSVQGQELSLRQAVNQLVSPLAGIGHREPPDSV
jgi:hypothetical protein